MRVTTTTITPGTTVKVRRPGPGERGRWQVTGRVHNSGLDDPAYDVQHQRSGRRRIFRRSRLILTRISR
jgi:hypothetical protein